MNQSVLIVFIWQSKVTFIKREKALVDILVFNLINFFKANNQCDNEWVNVGVGHDLCF